MSSLKISKTKLNFHSLSVPFIPDVHWNQFHSIILRRMFFAFLKFSSVSQNYLCLRNEFRVVRARMQTDAYSIPRSSIRNFSQSIDTFPALKLPKLCRIVHLIFIWDSVFTMHGQRPNVFIHIDSQILFFICKFYVFQSQRAKSSTRISKTNFSLFYPIVTQNSICGSSSRVHAPSREQTSAIQYRIHGLPSLFNK